MGGLGPGRSAGPTGGSSSACRKAAQHMEELASTGETDGLLTMVSARTSPARHLPAMLATHATASAHPSTHTPYDPYVRQASTLPPLETSPPLALDVRCSPMHSQVDREAMTSTASCARTWRTSWQATRKVGEVDYNIDDFSRATGSADRAARDGHVHAMRQSRGSSDWSLVGHY
jgi:hypothetical protein